MRVELDKKSLFALASDTRLDILRSLAPMRRTVSQLSETLNIDKSAVFRHLKKMEEGGLVKRHEDHGFVYYALTWKARDLMSPTENTKIVILLSASWLIAFSIIFVASASYLMLGEESVPESRGLLWPTGFPSAGENSYDSLAPEQESTSAVFWIPMYIALGIISSVLAVTGLRKLRKPRQSKPTPVSVSEKDLDISSESRLD
ncbi:MAG TPA: winged helix-turn-helix domain-containing protein [Thermoplasmata archaeon]